MLERSNKVTYAILQTLLNHLIPLVRNIHDTSLARRSFQFYLSFEEFLQKGINVPRRMCSTIGWTCLPWLCPKQERHFEALRRCTFLCSRPSLSCAPKLVHSLHICFHPQVCTSFFISKIPHLLLFSILNSHFHLCYRK